MSQAEELLKPKQGSKRNFVGGFQSSSNTITTLKYTGNFIQDHRLKGYEFNSNATMMVVNDLHNKKEIDLENLEKQLNTQNIVNNLHLNQVVSVTE